MESSPPPDESGDARELIAAERAWQAHEAKRRELSDARIRAVWHYVDGGHSLGETAKVMTAAGGRRVDKSYVNKLLACGYPEPSTAAS